MDLKRLPGLVKTLREYQAFEDCDQQEIDTLREAADMLEFLEPMNMALCERHSLVLRVGAPYIFRPVGDCPRCAEMLQQAVEAYGPSAGAT